VGGEIVLVLALVLGPGKPRWVEYEYEYEIGGACPSGCEGRRTRWISRSLWVHRTGMVQSGPPARRVGRSEPGAEGAWRPMPRVVRGESPCALKGRQRLDLPAGEGVDGTVPVPLQGTDPGGDNPGHRSPGSLSPGLGSRSPLGTQLPQPWVGIPVAVADALTPDLGWDPGPRWGQLTRGGWRSTGTTTGVGDVADLGTTSGWTGWGVGLPAGRGSGFMWGVQPVRTDTTP